MFLYFLCTVFCSVCVFFFVLFSVLFCLVCCFVRYDFPVLNVSFFFLFFLNFDCTFSMAHSVTENITPIFAKFFPQLLPLVYICLKDSRNCCFMGAVWGLQIRRKTVSCWYVIKMSKTTKREKKKQNRNSERGGEKAREKGREGRKRERSYKLENSNGARITPNATPARPPAGPQTVSDAVLLPSLSVLLPYRLRPRQLPLSSSCPASPSKRWELPFRTSFWAPAWRSPPFRAWGSSSRRDPAFDGEAKQRLAGLAAGGKAKRSCLSVEGPLPAAAVGEEGRPAAALIREQKWYRKVEAPSVDRWVRSISIEYCMSTPLISTYSGTGCVLATVRVVGVNLLVKFQRRILLFPLQISSQL